MTKISKRPSRARRGTFHLNRIEEAAVAFRQAAALKPFYANALCNLGSALHRLSKYGKAQQNRMIPSPKLALPPPCRKTLSMAIRSQRSTFP
jgi:tetratricopeptide (TPR) repeat protein